jgi:hypothetical protein
MSLTDKGIPMSRIPSALAATLALSVLLLSPAALAATQVQGRGDVPYESGLLSSKPDAAIRQKSLAEAKRNAVARLASSFSPAKYALFQKVEPQVYGQLDQYVIDAVVLDEGTNKDTKVYYTIVRASINDAKLDALLNGQGITNNQAAPSGKGAAISYLFVARETDSVRAFDTRRTDVAASASATSARQSQGLSGGRAHFNETSDETRTVTTGGSSLNKADETAYRVTSPENVNAAMTDIFSSKGFEVYDYRDVVSQCGGVDPKVIYAEFAKSDELSRETRNAAFAAARQCSINDFAFGTIDVGLQDVDPVTGNKRVYVSVRSQLMDLSGRLPRIIASVGPIQYAGLGPDQKVAMINALQLAAAEAARTIADQLNAKGVR